MRLRKKHVLVVLVFIIMGAVWAFKVPRKINYSSLHAAVPSAVEKIEHTIRHLALVMDGNRRWAHAKGLKAWDGHESGTKPVKTAVRFCIDQEIPYLSLYAFSLENFKRSSDELEHLFAIIEAGLDNEEMQELLAKGVRIKFIGERSLFPVRLRKTIEKYEQETALGTKLILNILFCYGGQQEIAASVKEIARKVKLGLLDPEELSVKTIEDYLWMQGSPAPDLVVRTGGEQRLSNFMLWQSAYSELMFLDIYWPDITTADLKKIVELYMQRRRNFGK